MYLPSRISNRKSFAETYNMCLQCTPQRAKYGEWEPTPDKVSLVKAEFVKTPSTEERGDFEVASCVGRGGGQSSMLLEGEVLGCRNWCRKNERTVPDCKIGGYR